MATRKAVGLLLMAWGMAPAFAQQPARTDDRDVTMRPLADPNAADANEILRKIPSDKPKHTTDDTDSPAKDLANPGAGTSDPGTPLDPGPPGSGDTPVTSPPVTVPPVTPAPFTPDPRDRPGDVG